MNKRLLQICFAAALLLNTRAADLPAQPLTIAVLPFDATDEKMRGKGEEAAALLSAKLSTNPALFTVERAEIDKLLAEHTLKLTGLADPASAVQAGHILGAKALVTGRIIASGDDYIFVAKVMSVTTSRVIGETVTTPKDAPLDKSAAELAAKVGQLLEKHAAVFSPPLETPAQRLARLRKFIEGKALPSIRIHIPEQHLRQTVPDPAVETEFKKTLLDLGFAIEDPASGRQADISITGQAFSEAGTRRGQLIAVRARVEVQALRRSDSKVLAADRETSAAVDIVESTAGKSALQNAATVLIERLLPKLVAP